MHTGQIRLVLLRTDSFSQELVTWNYCTSAGVLLALAGEGVE